MLMEALNGKIVGIVLLEEINEDKKNGERVCLWIGRLNILKISLLPNLIYRFNVIINKILIVFHETWQTDPKIWKRVNGGRKTKTHLKKNKVRDL